MNVYPTPKDLQKWIASSHKGEHFIYHTGHLVHDRKHRVYLATSGAYTTIEVKPLGDIADAAYHAYLDGFVVLAQKRLAEDVFQYLAIRTKKYVKPPLARSK